MEALVAEKRHELADAFLSVDPISPGDLEMNTDDDHQPISSLFLLETAGGYRNYCCASPNMHLTTKISSIACDLSSFLNPCSSFWLEGYADGACLINHSILTSRLMACKASLVMEHPQTVLLSKVLQCPQTVLLNKELLQLFGMPVRKAKFEAEALCAQRNSEGHVDAWNMADSDTFLFGAKCLIKSDSPNSKCQGLMVIINISGRKWRLDQLSRTVLQVKNRMNDAKSPVLHGTEAAQMHESDHVDVRDSTNSIQKASSPSSKDRSLNQNIGRDSKSIFLLVNLGNASYSFSVIFASAGVEHDKEFIVCSLDLLFGLVGRLCSGVESLAMHEITFSTDNKPKLLSQETELLKAALEKKQGDQVIAHHLLQVGLRKQVSKAILIMWKYLMMGLMSERLIQNI
ncbi:hypothetical protein Dsin_026627 [Dipteronia sinensis]|uniref:XPG-I domain-containing protein n=1 Tax=Dipteronia sinensis TaxID=43782 RepID=A0AAE0DY21_9ROSI|nr:hypothetical protein Dsin_026627 [Dipteronia sinensis]